MNIKRLFRTALIGLTALSISAAVMAAPRPGARCEGRHHKAPMMMKQLNLTPDQVSQLKGIHQQARAEAQRIKNSNLPQEQKQTQFKALRQQTKDRVAAVLTPEQLTKWQQMAKQHKARAGKAFAKLNLTPDQKQKAQAIRETLRQRITEIKSNQTLTNAQKKDQIQSVRRVAKDDFLAILTTEQRAKVQQFRHPRRERAG